ncbi:MAG: hypothetical protein IJL23_00685 [Alphaproteobacteria bacterium]|nr:hypothetical protein [Alphaproteobacteria bacterium]
MKHKTLFILTSLCAVTLLTSACTTCPTQTHDRGAYNQQHKKHNKKIHDGKPMVFQQTYSGSDVKRVKANMATRSSQGGDAEMGAIWFTETNEGLKMNADLVYLRPNKTYTAQIYQCGSCNDNTCCAMEAMSVELPTLSVSNAGDRLQQTYIVRGLTATQLNNAKIILTRDGGYKAAWGTLRQ